MSACSVAVVMGSRSDWPIMGSAVEVLEQLGVTVHAEVVSAHRTPLRLAEFAAGAEAAGYQVLIAGAGGAAHLPGMLAAQTLVPVIGVPIPATALAGMDAMLSIAQMPAGVPVATMAIGKPGAVNAGLFAAAMLASQQPAVAAALRQRREDAAAGVLAQPDPRQEVS
ncbi:MAG: 5-(carboxyamino)imidazole ribonucleotide mutase [Planctomycetota bacterium]|nr:5-(carboxyamino)imidazole ribonucleotide mutase [Planctomycetota bacterium]